MKKTIIAVWGYQDCGKTETIRGVLELLREMTGNKEPVPEGDVFEIIEVRGKKIGIESQGDPHSRLASSLAKFHRADCDLILCATRTKGSTINAVEQYEKEHGYHVLWQTTCQSWRKNNDEAEKIHKQLNNMTAKFVFETIGILLNGGL